MALSKIFRTKQKLRRKDAQRMSTTDLDTSGILAQPFPPMFSRAKSPCDILDFVGYPRVRPMEQPPSPIRQQPTFIDAPLTIRNKTPSTAANNSGDSFPSSTTHDFSCLHMPTPKKAMAPTWRILNADRTEKTLVMDHHQDNKDHGKIVKHKFDHEKKKG
ncbi:uncharacterized protein BX664DRAFT_329172 [Halteromyces radiatus]|uniref:uncharacterized protein n=1 Tax=Halteromyces radiatus TaxID=101107 RepID=UPI00221ED10B|nr:uncharacterized protein BX664DRAFT_329172 [Halteromyces radiatus]KAI8093208.1 hypothetical protein BX664DRAFT_329172 [Halteromyces radiatus]